MEIFGDDSGGFMDTADVAPLQNFKIFKMFPAKMETNKRSMKPVQQQYTFNNHIEDLLPMPIKTLTPLLDHNF
uniref:Uncharacterized protein n=1 Tax=Panagrolaimus sp. PS1159 TaxID=55785 RepID=A0AC35GW31_9BILA